MGTLEPYCKVPLITLTKVNKFQNKDFMKQKFSDGAMVVHNGVEGYDDA